MEPIRNLFSILISRVLNFVRNIKRKHYAHIAAIIMAALVLLWLGFEFLMPTPALRAGVAPVTIAQGSGLYAIADSLKQDGVIRNSTLFVMYVSLRGWSHKLQAGDFTIPMNSSLIAVASDLAQGTATRDIEVVIPEGSNIWQIDRILTQAGLNSNTAFARKYYQQDGEFFPDTYRFKPGTTIDDIAAKMRQNFQSRTQELLGNISSGQLERIITIASVLEKEARTEDDMSQVAGVINNRLKKGMSLEIDATVAYGACTKQFAANPTKDCQTNLVNLVDNIRIDSPFNSYTRDGIPPRPIANPGLDAIEAALHPTGDFLYYLSPAGGGDLIFEKTAAQHEADRKKYLGL